MSELMSNRAAEIARLHTAIVGRLRQSLQDALRIGELLDEQKRSMVHGDFSPWIAENLPFTDRTARNYMRLYRKRDRIKTETVSDLKSAYRLLVAPEGDNWEKIIRSYGYNCSRCSFEDRFGCVIEVSKNKGTYAGKQMFQRLVQTVIHRHHQIQ